MRILLSCCIVLLVFTVNAQFREPKFGKVEPAELQLTRYDKDTTADALMFFDFGYSRFDVNQARQFQFIYNRHFRIKIFRKSAFHYADVSIILHKNGSARENLENLLAVTYNMVDGKMVKTKLASDKIYKAESKNFVIEKFAFPEVKEGSVIELSYTINSDFLRNFRGWAFQHKYPTLWSQYEYVIPEYFSYRRSSRGYLPFEINKNEPGHATFKLHFESTNTAGFKGKLTPAEDEDLEAITTDAVLAVKDAPAFISESNIDCEDNYIQSIEFELGSVQYPNVPPKNYVQTWESVNKSMNDDEDFGSALNSKGFIRDTVAKLCNNKTSSLEKATAIYNYIQQCMRWNGEYNLWAPDGLKQPYHKHTGNSAEINLLLTVMLRTAGLDANPVMFSTRDNGIATTFYPTISRFNSVLAAITIDGKVSLLDASSKYCPFGVLPANDINGQGRVVDDKTGDWVDLTASEKSKELMTYSLEIDPDGKMKGSIAGNYGGYAAIVYRDMLSHEKSTDDYIRKLQETTKGLSVSHYSISNTDDNYKSISDSLDVELTDQAEVVGDKIIFNPMLFEKVEKNIYTLEERKYPVDYNYPVSSTIIFEYTIPDGYLVESIPQNFSLKLPDNSISISYIIQNTGNKIKLLFRKNVNKMLFLPSEYKDLKEFYNQIVRKHAEQIILKKKT